jgi:tRNA G26 N,N-dimethylase Trm1
VSSDVAAAACATAAANLRKASPSGIFAIIQHDATSAAALRPRLFFDFIDCDPCGGAFIYLPALMSAARDGAIVCFSAFNSADLIRMSVCAAD